MRIRLHSTAVVLAFVGADGSALAQFPTERFVPPGVLIPGGGFNGGDARGVGSGADLLGPLGQGDVVASLGESLDGAPYFGTLRPSTLDVAPYLDADGFPVGGAPDLQLWAFAPDDERDRATFVENWSEFIAPEDLDAFSIATLDGELDTFGCFPSPDDAGEIQLGFLVAIAELQDLYTEALPGASDTTFAPTAALSSCGEVRQALEVNLESAGIIEHDRILGIEDGGQRFDPEEQEAWLNNLRALDRLLRQTGVEDLCFAILELIDEANPRSQIAQDLRCSAVQGSIRARSQDAFLSLDREAGAGLVDFPIVLIGFPRDLAATTRSDHREVYDGVIRISVTYRGDLLVEYLDGLYGKCFSTIEIDRCRHAQSGVDAVGSDTREMYSWLDAEIISRLEGRLYP